MVMMEEKDVLVLNDSELGDWFLTELFRRLPLKPLFKFKCVSKRWFSLISDPSLPRSRTDMPSHTLLCTHDDHDLSNKIKTHPQLQGFNVRLGFVPKDPEKLQLVAADKGLVLSSELNGYYTQYYYVSNPLTGQCAPLPELQITHDYTRGVGLIVGSESMYKVIRIEKIKGHSLKLDSFDSSTRQWKSCTVQLPCPMNELYGFHDTGVVYRGALHWIAVSGNSDGIKVIAYDPAVHELQGDSYGCRVFDCPPPCYRFPIFANLGLSGGQVRYAENGGTSFYDRNSGFLSLWLLKDYESGEWCFEHKIVHSELGYNVLYFTAFNAIDKDMVYFCHHRSESTYTANVSYSISARTVTLLCNAPLKTLQLSFVLPPWPTPL